MPRDSATLLDIVNAATLAIRFTQGMPREEFLADQKTQSAIAHQLLILGEATKRLSEEFRHQHPELPWRLMAGMRDKLIHDYDSIDVDQMWDTVQKDIPKVIQFIEPLVPKAD